MQGKILYIVERYLLVLCWELIDSLNFVVTVNLSVNKERLLRLERMGLFSPIFRVRTPDQGSPSFYIPVREGNDWFIKKWAWDTTGILGNYKVPDEKDPTQEGYYSIFQIDQLNIVLQGLTLQVQLDGYLDSMHKEDINWEKNQASTYLGKKRK